MRLLHVGQFARRSSSRAAGHPQSNLRDRALRTSRAHSCPALRHGRAATRDRAFGLSRSFGRGRRREVDSDDRRDHRPALRHRRRSLNFPILTFVSNAGAERPDLDVLVLEEKVMGHRPDLHAIGDGRSVSLDRDLPPSFHLSRREETNRLRRVGSHRGASKLRSRLDSRNTQQGDHQAPQYEGDEKRREDHGIATGPIEGVGCDGRAG